MSSYQENGSRLDRIEAIILELATASVRHDNEFSRINAALDRIDEQQAANARQIEATTRQIEANTRQGALNQENIQILTASIQELRNLVADYIQGRLTGRSRLRGSLPLCSILDTATTPRRASPAYSLLKSQRH